MLARLVRWGFHALAFTAPLLGIAAVVALGPPVVQRGSASPVEPHDPTRCEACQQQFDQINPELRNGRKLYLTTFPNVGSLYRWMTPEEVVKVRQGGWVAVPARPEDVGVKPIGAGHTATPPRLDTSKRPATDPAETPISVGDTR